MLAKLISLLLHAKAGAVSGVFLLGATGALVSVSASNGVTTITITEPSASPSASASAHPSASPSASPTASASPHASASPKPSSSSSPKPADACADQAKALAFQVKRVDEAFKGFHTQLEGFRKTQERETLQTSDTLLRVIRQAAVKAIHATSTCRKHDDDEDESHDTATTSTSLNSDRETDEDNDEDSAKDKDAAKHKPTVTFSGTDPKAIADQAIAAMQVAFDAAKNAAAKTPKPSHSTESAKTSHTPQSKGKSGEHRD